MQKVRDSVRYAISKICKFIHSGFTWHVIIFPYRLLNIEPKVKNKVHVVCEIIAKRKLVISVSYPDVFLAYQFFCVLELN